MEPDEPTEPTEPNEPTGPVYKSAPGYLGGGPRLKKTLSVVRSQDFYPNTLGDNRDESPSHQNRAWRLAAAKLAADAPAERELNREVGESTRECYELAHELAQIIATEVHDWWAEEEGIDYLRFWMHCMGDGQP